MNTKSKSDQSTFFTCLEERLFPVFDEAGNEILPCGKGFCHTKDERPFHPRTIQCANDRCRKPFRSRCLGTIFCCETCFHEVDTQRQWEASKSKLETAEERETRKKAKRKESLKKANQRYRKTQKYKMHKRPANRRCYATRKASGKAQEYYQRQRKEKLQKQTSAPPDKIEWQEKQDERIDSAITGERLSIRNLPSREEPLSVPDPLPTLEPAKPVEQTPVLPEPPAKAPGPVGERTPAPTEPPSVESILFPKHVQKTQIEKLAEPAPQSPEESLRSDQAVCLLPGCRCLIPPGRLAWGGQQLYCCPEHRSRMRLLRLRAKRAYALIPCSQTERTLRYLQIIMSGIPP